MLFKVILTVIFMLNCVNTQGIRCTTAFDEDGTCVKLSDCFESENWYASNNLLNQTAIEFLVTNHKNCGLRAVNLEPIICCKDRLPITQIIFPTSNQDQNVPKLLNPSNGCGSVLQTNTKPFDQGGVRINSWPWLALIGYTDHNGLFSFRCGGSLITKRHVLTAAHCVDYDLTTVRLGEHDLGTVNETKHIDVPVINIITHPNYDERDGSSDLTIFVLGQDILFTQEISPICLPIMELIENKNYKGYHPFIAGWGFSQNDRNDLNVLQELQLPVIDNDECVGQFNANVTNDIICVELMSDGNNVCYGDSGGPLMIPIVGFDREYYFYQIGIFSNSKECIRPGRSYIFTKLASFVDWIQEQVIKPI